MGPHAGVATRRRTLTSRTLQSPQRQLLLLTRSQTEEPLRSPTERPRATGQEAPAHEGYTPPHTHPQSGVMTGQPARAETASDALGPCSGADTPHISVGTKQPHDGRESVPQDSAQRAPHFRGGLEPGHGQASSEGRGPAAKQDHRGLVPSLPAPFVVSPKLKPNSPSCTHKAGEAGSTSLPTGREPRGRGLGPQPQGGFPPTLPTGPHLFPSRSENQPRLSAMTWCFWQPGQVTMTTPR